MTKPNFLLITTDQQRFDTIASQGNPYIHTPHLDWLCDEGIVFSRAYTDSPICMPARATIMTGKHGYTIGLTGNNHKVLPMKDNPTLPGVLTANGYQTRAQGKMHFEPMHTPYGFEYMELPWDYCRDCHRTAEKGLPKEHGVGENEMSPVISTVDETRSLTHWTVQRSIDFLETRDVTRPFFMWTSFAKPHPPFDPCANYWALYNGKDVGEPAEGDWSEAVEDIPQGFMESTYVLNNAYRASKQQLIDSRRAYYACITQIDYQLGLLFARMREMNLLENTWIIFTSDHGELMGDHHMGAKSVHLEGAAHIPLIVRPPLGSWKDNKLGTKKVDRIAMLTDIMPTILNQAGITGVDMDGVDLMSLADQEQDRRFVGDCSGKYFCVMEDNVKYLWTSIGGGELLFDLNEDPKEEKNLLNDDAMADKLAGLRKALVEHLSEYESEYVQDGQLKPGPGISGPGDVSKWPGLHSTVYPTDVLH